MPGFFALPWYVALTIIKTASRISLGNLPHTRIKNPNTVVRVTPDGSIEVRAGKTAATTQPATERTETRAAATSQPSTTQTTTSEQSEQKPTATSASGLPGFTYDKDGNITGISIKPNVIAERLKAVLIPTLTLVLLGGFLVYRGKWGVGVALIVLGFALGAYPELAVYGVVAGVGVLVYHLWSTQRQTADSQDHSLTQAVKDGVINEQQASDLRAYAAERQDGWLQKLLNKGGAS